MTAVLILVLAGGVGFLIGSVGVGGILLIPPLALLANMSIHEASATALLTFLFTGIFGTWLFSRRGNIEWRIAGPVCAGSVVFAYLGAWTNSIVNARVLETVIAGVVLAAGVYIAIPASARSRREHPVRDQPALLVGLGAICGFGSGVTGAGGPLFSVPLMLLLGFAPLTAIGTGQVLQIAAASAGSIGNLRYGSIDFSYAVALTVAELTGVYGGVRFAHWLDPRVLRLMVAVLCVAAGALMLARLHSS